VSIVGSSCDEVKMNTPRLETARVVVVVGCFRNADSRNQSESMER
jgi:hypothetical protein